MRVYRRDEVKRKIKLLLDSGYNLTEVGAMFGATRQTAAAWLKKGTVQKASLERQILDAPTELIPVTSEPIKNKIRLIGDVRGGDLCASLEEADEFIEAPYKPDNHFALKVRGDSMSGAGIMPGDIVIIRIQQDATDNDIVVARHGEETTIKRFKHLSSGIFLVPANDKYKPIPFKGCKIIGKVVDLRRKY